MKYIFIVLIYFLSNLVFANEVENNEIEIINLHESKSLDQMVLDNINKEDNFEEIIDNSNVSDEIQTIEVEINKVQDIKDNFIFNNSILDLKTYFDNLKNISSKTIQLEINEVLENLQLNLDIDQDKEIFFLIVNYFKSIGQINKSYNLIEKYDLQDDKNSNYYTAIKINYFLSTFQLNEACNFKEEINSNIKIDYFLLEKLDIFCLTLNNNQSEASLLNSILIESENNLDKYFQLLFSLISNTSEKLNFDEDINEIEINSDLIFLYSAMIRIAELPFTHAFYQLDKRNLSIPIILNQASPIDLRIKAANDSFLDSLINVESLAALYLSADFNSDQLNNPQETIDSLSDNIELSMVFLFQLVNIQIFPNDRLNALIQFWNFAKKNNLEEIAYKLSENMLSSIEVSSENIMYGTQIASAYIFNKNFEEAVTWIELYEKAKQIDSKSIYTRVLLDLYSSTDLNSFTNSINLTLNNYTDDQNNENEELLFVLKGIMNLDINSNPRITLNKIFDERSMPSIFLYNEIKNSILNKNQDKFLIFSSISLNGKDWSNIHPEHLKIILEGYLIYNDGEVFRNLILEVFKNYKFII